MSLVLWRPDLVEGTVVRPVERAHGAVGCRAGRVRGGVDIARPHAAARRTPTRAGASGRASGTARPVTPPEAVAPPVPWALPPLPPLAVAPPEAVGAPPLPFAPPVAVAPPEALEPPLPAAWCRRIRSCRRRRCRQLPCREPPTPAPPEPVRRPFRRSPRHCRSSPLRARGSSRRRRQSSPCWADRSRRRPRERTPRSAADKAASTRFECALQFRYSVTMRSARVSVGSATALGLVSIAFVNRDLSELRKKSLLFVEESFQATGPIAASRYRLCLQPSVC